MWQAYCTESHSSWPTSNEAPRHTLFDPNTDVSTWIHDFEDVTLIQPHTEPKPISRQPRIAYLLALCVGLAAVAGTSLLPSGGALAQSDEEQSRPRQATRRIPAMSEAVFNQLAEAQEMVEAKDYRGAREHLMKLLDRRRLNGNERAQIHNLLAYVALEQEDNRTGITHLERVLAEGDQITEGLEVNTLYTLAQLFFIEENYNKSLEYMKRRMAKEVNPSPQQLVFLGQIYYQKGDIPSAIIEIERAIEVAKASNLEVKESWWAMLRYFYYEQKNIAKAIDILKILVRDFPKQDYWIQLCGMYSELEQENNVMACFEAAHVGGHLDRETLMKNYAGLLMNAGAPIRAAKYFREAMDAKLVTETEDNFTTLGQGYQFSQEHDEAIDAFEAAAKLADKGNIYENLTQLYYERDDFQECVEAAESATKKGGVRREGSLLIVKGLCLYNLDELSKSRTAFVDARSVSRRNRVDADARTASQWITYLDKEKARRDTLSARQ